MTYSTQAELEAGLAYWRRVLRLQDWTVIVRFVRQTDIGATSSGECQTWPELKKARIGILDTIDAHDHLWPHDQEQVLVHELLHLSFEPCQRVIWDHEDLKDRMYIPMENFIDLTATALVERNRGNK